MLTFIAYTAACLAALWLNADADKRDVCRYSVVGLCLGMLVNPVLGYVDALTGYLIVSQITLLIALLMPCARHYSWYVPALYVAMLGFCVVGALSVIYKFESFVPYSTVIHSLNLTQIFILVVGSDVFIRKFNELVGGRRNHTQRGIRRLGNAKQVS